MMKRPVLPIATLDPLAFGSARTDCEFDIEAGADHTLGRRLLESDWREEPALARLIGPRFDRSSCGDCHAEAGMPAGDAHDEPVRIARPAEGASGVPRYTRHTDDSGVESRRLALDFVRRPGRFDDGLPYELRSVVATLADGERDIGPDRLALRVAPALFGWGLLERVAPAALARMADPADRDGDGISGRMIVADGRLGRFGWKATQPSLRRQSAAALYHDMGVTTDEFPDSACASAPAERCRVELPGDELDALVAYVAALGVPDRRDRQAEPVRRGARLFSRIGCADCHVPVLTVENESPTGNGTPVGTSSTDVLWPYSDLLLHDMGEALADPVPRASAPHGSSIRASAMPVRVAAVASATASATASAAASAAAPAAAPASRHEWRTPPLWGIGLLAARHGQRFLHDGRARTPLEAALWHGGEGAAAKRRLLALPANDRAALVAFLGSL